VCVCVRVCGVCDCVWWVWDGEVEGGREGDSVCVCVLACVRERENE
jgi:hypothetical protein